MTTTPEPSRRNAADARDETGHGGGVVRRLLIDGAGGALAGRGGRPGAARPWWAVLLERPWAQASAMLVVSLILGGLATALLPIDALLDRRHDVQARQWAPQRPADGAVVVDIDDVSMRRLGAWPVPRPSYLPVLRWLESSGARTVAITFVMSDPAPGDAVFGDWLAQARVPVVLAAAPTAPGGAAEVEMEGVAAQAAPDACPMRPVGGFHLPVWVRREPGRPSLRIQDVGGVGLPLDDDGMLRSFSPWSQAGSIVLPLLPLAAIERGVAGHRGWEEWRCSRSDRRLWVSHGATRWPVDAAGRVRPWLAQQPAPSLPYWRLDAAARGIATPAEQAELAQTVRGRTVYLGSTAASSLQVLTSGGLLSGTRTLAAIDDALSKGHVLAPPVRFDLPLLAVLLLPWAAFGLSGRRMRSVTAEGAEDEAESSHAWQRRRRTWVSWSLVAAIALVVVVDVVRVAAFGELSHIGWPLAALFAWGALLLARRRWRAARAEQQQRARSERLARANAAKSDFMAHVGHELRTPLNALLGAADLLSQTHLEPQQRHYVRMFRSAGRELLHMLNDLMDLSRSEAGALELYVAPFSLTRLVAQQIALFEPRAQQKGLKLHVETADDLPERVMGDAARLAQILRNLLGNAIKFTTRGSVTLRLASQPGGVVRIEVADTGIGIAADKIDRIFAPYVQAAETADLRAAGSGLGLAIVRRLVETMRGSVSVTSELGHGSTFQVDLPMPEADEAAIAAAEGADTQMTQLTAWNDVAGERTTTHTTRAGMLDGVPGAGPIGTGMPPRLKLLAADDSPYNLMLLQAYLDGSGHSLQVRYDGLSALQEAQAHRYDVLLLDFNMPGMDGPAVARALRAHERAHGRPPARLVLVSGQTDPVLLAEAREAGFTASLVKPFARDELLDLLQAITGGGPGGVAGGTGGERAAPASGHGMPWAPPRAPAAEAPVVRAAARVHGQPAWSGGTRLPPVAPQGMPMGSLAVGRPSDFSPMPVEIDEASAAQAAATLHGGLRSPDWQELPTTLPAATVPGGAPAPSAGAARAPGSHWIDGRQDVRTAGRLDARAAASGLQAEPTLPGIMATALDTLPDSDVDTAVRRLGGIGLYDHVVSAARRPLEEFETSIDAALERRPPHLEQATRLAHDLKSMAATLGLPGLAGDADRLEMALRRTSDPGEDPAVVGARRAVGTRIRAVVEVLRSDG